MGTRGYAAIPKQDRRGAVVGVWPATHGTLQHPRRAVIWQIGVEVRVLDDGAVGQLRRPLGGALMLVLQEHLDRRSDVFPPDPARKGDFLLILRRADADRSVDVDPARRVDGVAKHPTSRLRFPVAE